jgi:hypothetical protein
MLVVSASVTGNLSIIILFFASLITLLNTLRTGNFLLKIFHTSLIWSEVPFTIRRKAPSIV